MRHVLAGADMIIIINGPINSGKSTIAKLLAEKLGNTAHIEVDNLRAFVGFMPLDQNVINLNLRNTALVANTFVQAGLNVVISYPLATADYHFLIEKLKKLNASIFTLTLSPRLDVALSNRGKRQLTEWEQNRIKEHYQLGIAKPEYDSIILDNSDQTPNETVQTILSHLPKALK